MESLIYACCEFCSSRINKAGFSFKLFILTIFSLTFTVSRIQAQTVSDDVMMKQWETCFALSFEHAFYDHYWEGELLRINETVATVNRNTARVDVILGLHKNLNFLIGLPWVATHSSEPNGGFFKGINGLQDLSMALKFKALDLKSEGDKHVVNVLVSSQLSFPVSKYHADYQPYSLGLGTTEIGNRLIINYSYKGGFYTRANAGFIWRGLAQTDREYYYNNGSYYTHDMDVPSAMEYQGVAGIWLMEHHLKFELNYVGLRSMSGDDIRLYNRSQPTNCVNFDQMGIATQYYFKQIDGLGLIAYANRVINGRNTAQFSRFGVAVTYFLNK